MFPAELGLSILALCLHSPLLLSTLDRTLQAILSRFYSCATTRPPPPQVTIVAPLRLLGLTSQDFDPAPKWNEKFGYCRLDLVWCRWISWSLWRGFCGYWKVLRFTLHYNREIGLLVEYLLSLKQTYLLNTSNMFPEYWLAYILLYNCKLYKNV